MAGLTSVGDRKMEESDESLESDDLRLANAIGLLFVGLSLTDFLAGTSAGEESGLFVKKNDIGEMFSGIRVVSKQPSSLAVH